MYMTADRNCEFENIRLRNYSTYQLNLPLQCEEAPQNEQHHSARILHLQETPLVLMSSSFPIANGDAVQGSDLVLRIHHLLDRYRETLEKTDLEYIV